MDNMNTNTAPLETPSAPTVAGQTDVRGQLKGWWERTTNQKLSRGEKAILILMAVFFLILFYISLDANKYRATVRVIKGEGKVGINPTTEVIDFGDLSRGTSAVRTVTVKNATPVPFFVTVWKFGAVSDLMKEDVNNFVLHRGEERKIQFTAYMPASAEINHVYDGRVLVFKIPAPGF